LPVIGLANTPSNGQWVIGHCCHWSRHEHWLSRLVIGWLAVGWLVGHWPGWVIAITVGHWLSAGHGLALPVNGWSLVIIRRSLPLLQAGYWLVKVGRLVGHWLRWLVITSYGCHWLPGHYRLVSGHWVVTGWLIRRYAIAVTVGLL